MHDTKPSGADRGVISTRTMEIVVAVLFLVVSAVVIQDSLRVGAGWAENEGPRAGYFPFYIGIIMALAALVILVRTVLEGVQERRARQDGGGRRQADGSADESPFVTAEALKRVLLVLVPVIVYGVVIELVGIYVASAIYITCFMMYFGGYRIVSSAATGIIVSVAMFMMFEIWFLVPLPKGPLETFLGF